MDDRAGRGRTKGILGTVPRGPRGPEGTLGALGLHGLLSSDTAISHTSILFSAARVRQCSTTCFAFPIQDNFHAMQGQVTFKSRCLHEAELQSRFWACQMVRSLHHCHVVSLGALADTLTGCDQGPERRPLAIQGSLLDVGVTRGTKSITLPWSGGLGVRRVCGRSCAVVCATSFTLLGAGGAQPPRGL